MSKDSYSIFCKSKEYCSDCEFYGEVSSDGCYKAYENKLRSYEEMGKSDFDVFCEGFKFCNQCEFKGCSSSSECKEEYYKKYGDKSILVNKIIAIEEKLTRILELLENKSNFSRFCDSQPNCRECEFKGDHCKETYNIKYGK